MAEKFLDAIELVEIKEGLKMSSVMQAIINEAVDEAVNKAVDEAVINTENETTLRNIRNMMNTLKLTAKQAMDALLIPETERKKYASKL